MKYISWWGKSIGSDQRLGSIRGGRRKRHTTRKWSLIFSEQPESVRYGFVQFEILEQALVDKCNAQSELFIAEWVRQKRSVKQMYQLMDDGCNNQLNQAK